MSAPFGPLTGESESEDHGRSDAFDNQHYGPGSSMRTRNGSTVG